MLSLVKKRKVVIDCDPGVDDALSVLIALNCPDVHVIAILISSGNTVTRRGLVNISKFLSFIKEYNIPVFIGNDMNYMGDLVTESDGYFGEDGFCEIQLPDTVNSSVIRKDPWIVLKKIAKMYPNEVTLVCMGPLTNIAKSFIAYPYIKSLFQDVFVMGGNREEKVLFFHKKNYKTEYNVSEYAEFNAFVDPLAYEIVLKNFSPASQNPVFVIDWKFCLEHALNVTLFRKMAFVPPNQERNNKKVFVQMLIDSPACTHIFSLDACSTENAQTSQNPSAEADCGLRTTTIVADQFIMIAACYPHLIGSITKANLSHVVLRGEKKGQTVFTSEKPLFNDAKFSVALINKIGMESIEKIMIQSTAE